VRVPLTPVVVSIGHPENENEDAGDEGQMRRLIVTIDGPAGTGKSSVARDLAKALGLEFLDTGAMYRAATALAIDNGLNLHDEHAVIRLLRDADLTFDWSTDPPTLLAFGKSIMNRLRDADVSGSVSPVSQLRAVREVLVEAQRRIGEAHPRLVSEGRDQGSVVFHDAEVKFYMTASVEERTRRRVRQLLDAGRSVDEAAIRDEIVDRDTRDSSREVGPLVCPDDAESVDTSDMCQDEVVRTLADVVRRRAPEALANLAGVARAS
jgi:cytidylate kinase